jgi:HK97 family phage portal protein
MADYAPLTVYESRTVRFLRAVGLLRVEDAKPETVTPGGDWATGTPMFAPYDRRRAMSALVASPYLAACVTSVAEDLAGLPLKAARRVRVDGQWTLEPVTDHPALDVIAKPSSDPTVTGRSLRTQLAVDKQLAGDAFALITTLGGKPVGLQRLHPARVDLEPTPYGTISSVGFSRSTHSKQSYDPNTVLIWRGVSWADDPSGLFGIGYAQILDSDIQAELALSRSTATQAKKGRPDGIYAPSDKERIWNDRDVQRQKVQLDNVLSASTGGVAVLSGAGTLTPLGWAPRDMANVEQSDNIRTKIMALTGVPPIRLGLETANYATSENQMRVYWMRLLSTATGIDEQFTRLAQKWDADVVVYHDFSQVAALQNDALAMLEQVKQHIANGMSPADAYAYVGFDDIPEIFDPIAEPAQPQNPAAQDGEAKTTALPWVKSEPATAALERPATAEARDLYWKGWLSSIQAPAERALTRVWKAELKAASARYARRAGRVLGDRKALGADGIVTKATISQAEMNEILDSSGEIAVLTEGVPPSVVRRGLRAAFARAARELGEDLAWSPDLDPTTEVIADMVTFVEQATKDRIAAVVRTSLSEGIQVNDLQKLIQQDAMFSPMRALRVSRTETAKVLSKGTRLAYDDAAKAGVEFRVEWLSAKDEHVRPDHEALEGVQVKPGEDFTVPDTGPDQLYAGETGAGPGEFAEAGMVVNCRCTTIPVLT